MAKPEKLFDCLPQQHGLIKLDEGSPGPSFLKNCNKMFLHASTCLLNDDKEEEFTFQYGPIGGDPEFLEELAKFLSTEYGDEVNSDNVILTSSATSGLSLTISQLFSPGSVIFIQDPTFFKTIRILKDDFQMNVISVPTDEQGMVVDGLEKLLIKHKPVNFERSRSNPFWTMIYLLSVFDNPTGKSLPAERCQDLIKVARTHDVLLFVDDVYNLLQYNDTEFPPKRLLKYDEPSDPDYRGNVISNGTFSKILAPGLRLGWMEGSKELLDLLRNSQRSWSSGSFNHYTSKLVTIIMRSGDLSRNLQRVRPLYKKRIETLCRVLKENLGSNVTFYIPKGGPFLWIAVPEKLKTDELLKLSRDKYLVDYIPGALTTLSDKFANYMRISVSLCSEDEVEKGAKNICLLIKDTLTSYPS